VGHEGWNIWDGLALIFTDVLKCMSPAYVKSKLCRKTPVPEWIRKRALTVSLLNESLCPKLRITVSQLSFNKESQRTVNKYWIQPVYETILVHLVSKLLFYITNIQLYFLKDTEAFLSKWRHLLIIFFHFCTWSPS
jgi:hypothetical protein